MVSVTPQCCGVIPLRETLRSSRARGAVSLPKASYAVRPALRDRHTMKPVFPARGDLPLSHTGSASIRASCPGLSLKQDSLSYNRPATVHGAASFTLCYDLRFRPASLTEFDTRIPFCPFFASALKLSDSCTADAFTMPCRSKFSLHITAQTRPQPTHC